MSESTTSPTPSSPDPRVPIPQKVAYGLGSFNDLWGNWLYPSLVWPVFNIFLHVNPALVSTALMVNRLVDALSDPFFGWLSDNTRSRFGRRRPFILIGSILAGLTFPLLFFVSPDWSEKQIFIYMLVSSGLFITIVSCFNMPYQSLGNEMTPDYEERTSVFAWKGAIQKPGEVVLFLAAAFVTWEIFNDPATGEADSLHAARVYTTIFGILIMVVGVVLFFTIKERYYETLVKENTKRISVADSIWKALKCRPFRAQLAMALAFGLGTSMLGVLGYYTTVYYVCHGDVALGSKWNIAMGFGNMIFGLIGIPIFARLADRYGKRHAMLAVQAFGVFAFISTWWLYDPNYPFLQVFASGLIAFTGASFWMLYGSIGADVIDYDELEHGMRREGAFAACGTYIMKVGLALGAGGSGFVLAATGFLAELGPDQSEETLTHMRLALAGIPIIGLVFAFLALRRFGLTRETVEDVRRQLEARRGKV